MHSVKQLLRSFPMAALVIACLSLLVVWPTLVEQHWGLLDDGVTLAVARELQNRWHLPASAEGRYFPAYFAYYALEYRFFGTGIGGYYAVQALVLILTTLLLYAIVHMLTGRSGLGWLAVCLFLTSSPVAENYYTLSKQEPRLLLYLLISLYCYMRADLATQQPSLHFRSRRLPRLGAPLWGAASAVSLMVAYLTKETTLVALPAACLWVLVVFWREKGAARRTRAALGYLGINLLTFTLFAVAAYVYTPTPLPWAGSYTGEGLRLVPSMDMLRYYLHVNFDVLLLVGLASAGVVGWSVLQPRALSPLTSYAVFCLLCAGAYVALFVCVWKLSLSYYLLPAAGWGALALSLVVKMLILDQPLALLRSSMICILVAVLVLSRLYSIPTLYNAAVALKAWHQVNGQMIAWASTLSENSRLQFVNVPKEHEYIVEAQLLLGLLYGRVDIAVTGASNVGDILQQARSGDVLVINFGGEHNRHVWVRGAQGLPPLEHSKQAVVSATPSLRLEEAFRAESEKKILPPFSMRPRPFVLGWAGYRVATRAE